jgi:hypothetical protein
MSKFIKNTGDYFSNNYFDEDFAKKVFDKSGYGSDDVKAFNRKVSPISDKLYRLKQNFIEGKLRIKDKIFETHQFHTFLLKTLGYDAGGVQYEQLFHLNETEVIPVKHILYRGDQTHLMIMEMQALIKEDDSEPEGLFEQSYNIAEEELSHPPQKYHRSQWDRVFETPKDVKISPVIINKAVSELFLLEPHQRPKYILLLAGNVIFLLEQEKWFKGSYLQIELEELFSEATASRAANYYALLYFLIGKESLAPDSNMVLLDQLDEDSHKSAYEVTKDLKEGIIHAVEALANEALFYRKEVLHEEFDETNDTYEEEIKNDCLRIIYRMLFIFYAESREDLDILPSNDSIYSRGYSLEMLRDLEQVPLYSDHSLNGYFFHESIKRLFSLLSSGYREKETENKSFRVRHIDSPIFDDNKLHHLGTVKFRNKIWQDIICRLSLSKEVRGRSRGRISYASLGINQLGSVYESLLAYRGFYAEEDYIEVHKKNKPQDGTYLVPRRRRDDYKESEILKRQEGDEDVDVILVKGTFVYRLSGRDRQKSASYYTPEVLTRSTVKYTLKPLLEKLDNGEIKAKELLDLKLLEPAMGAAAFQNEMINQLSEAYLAYRQKELATEGKKAWRVEPDKYKEELQKIKAYIATNNTYGVDLNPTAIELGKLSLWLNVIHKDMETPFFSNRIAVGNAVVGAWLRVYDIKIISETLGENGKPLKKQPKKEWWETAPKQLAFTPQEGYVKIKSDRNKEREVYHFLLPDKNMLASAGIKLLKEDIIDKHAGSEIDPLKAIANWKKDWSKPLNKEELIIVKRLSDKVDLLLTEYYKFQRMINQKTATKQEIFGVPVKQMEVQLSSYDEKEKLDDQRNRQNAPYFKLKMVMDYWCSLWFWDMRQATELPTRRQYWQDLERIIQLDTEKALDGVLAKAHQTKIFDNTGVQLTMAMEPAAPKEAFIKLITEDEEQTKSNFFDENERVHTVQELAATYHFFHPQLEFLEVFWERGGFDLIAGNPPWLKLQFEEKGIISEKFPEVEIRKVSAPQVRLLQDKFFENQNLKELYYAEMIGIEAASVFMNAMQNYPLLRGQQTNLYKCVLTNGFELLNNHGFMGLIHPEGVYDEPNGQILRIEIFLRLKYHFQFRNELSLFAEVGHTREFSINVLGSIKKNINFSSISNLYHPTTIDGSFIHNGLGVSGGIKNEILENTKSEWNISSHAKRIININDSALKLISKVFDKEVDFRGTKLPYIHTSSILDVLNSISDFSTFVNNNESYVSEGWHEVSEIGKNIIEKLELPDYENYELIYTGKHIYVANPLYKSPDLGSYKFEIIDHTLISKSFIPNSLFSINNDKSVIKENSGIVFNNSFWIDNYKVAFRKMLDKGMERTYIPVILPPKASHTNGIISIVFKSILKTVEFAGISSSILLDFYIKLLGKSNLYDNTIKNLPLGISKHFLNSLYLRTLLLNAINENYSSLWVDVFRSSFLNDNWSKEDCRLKSFDSLTPNWQWSTPLRNWFERRQALVEIDVIVAMAVGLRLEELILIYNVQFPVLQQNEDDTWYDTTGNIVFTCSKGLTGVGLDRVDWNNIKDMKAGETYTHTITKSELYYGKEVVYHAPFNKCDRVEDYKVAWAFFEGRFGG